MEVEEFQPFDIVKVEVLSDFCGLKCGTYKGTVVAMIGEEKLVIIFNSIAASKRSNKHMTAPYLNYDAWGNCEIRLLHRSDW